MKFKIEWIETKSPEWKVAHLTKDDGTNLMDVSINKKDKNSGEEFPNFDNLKAGDTIEGEHWTSKTGKHYLFNPKPVVGTPTGRRMGGNVAKLMEKKAENIEKAQERKAESIAFFNATNSAIALLKEFGLQEMGEAEIKTKLRVWRDWFIKEHEDFAQGQPF